MTAETSEAAVELANPRVSNDTRLRGAAKPRQPAWVRAYRQRLLLSDSCAIFLTLVGSHLLRFGTSLPSIGVAGASLSTPYISLGVIIAVGWSLSLGLADSRGAKFVGATGEEYRRVIKASIEVFAAIAILSFSARLRIAPAYLAVVASAGTALLLLERLLWRRWLTAKRGAGTAIRRTVVLGSPTDVAHICLEIARAPTTGLRVTGVCTPDQPLAASRSSVGTVDDLIHQVYSGEVDAVIVASAGERSREIVRRLGWALEGTGASLMIVPSLIGVAGRRIHLQPAAGITLMHVEEAKLPRGGQFAKELVDRTVAGLLIVFLSPVLGAVALVVRLGSPGPALFKQERIGRCGKVFKIWKFRSMRVNADEQLLTLLKAAGRGATPLFKLDNDPRVTRVGAFIRKTSLDELPQLFNVVAGQMSLVGPRPQRAAEVELYDEIAHRRLLAKPGMTGLGQVSGRSNLPWHESVRHDIYYVDNWSLTFDLILLLKTIRAVFGGVGAH